MMRETGVDAVMAAEGLLNNPALFHGENGPSSLELAEEYVNLVREHPAHPGMIRGHLFHLLHQYLALFPDLRPELASAKFDKLVNFPTLIRERIAAMNPQDFEKEFSKQEPWYWRHRKAEFRRLFGIEDDDDEVKANANQQEENSSSESGDDPTLDTLEDVDLD
eukprot:GABV01001452.1.p1 GENE.GABV01001452.1~~GABV01001452.1.p1  ORF type:complete len:164 (-),score=74.67 GABV01001452.1:1-492(-)